MLLKTVSGNVEHIAMVEKEGTSLQRCFKRCVSKLNARFNDQLGKMHALFRSREKESGIELVAAVGEEQRVIPPSIAYSYLHHA